VVKAHGTVGYRLPSRFMGSLQAEVAPGVLVEAMGGYVMWSVFDDFDIVVKDTDELNDFANEETHTKVDQHRTWARDNVDSFWVGTDIKAEVGELTTVGGRVMFDKSAVPTEVLSPNNYDTDTIMLSGMVAYEAVPGIQFGLSFTEHMAAARTVTSSAFGMSVDPELRREDRYFYPQMAGTYRSSIHRFGISVRGQFGSTDTDR
jgi:long-subunit fatty acid transport protein